MLLNCWEFMHCGNGPRSGDEPGRCPASADPGGEGRNGGDRGGRICWAVSGTLCGGRIQGTFAQKELQCVACEFFMAVRAEEGADFRLLLPGQRAEDVLRESDLRYRRMFDSVPVGLYRTGPQGQFLDANLALLGLLGMPDLKALRETRMDDLLMESAESAGRSEALAREGAVIGLELRLRKRDGTPIRARESARAQLDAAGQVLYIEGSLEDVTERRKVEDQLLQAQRVELAGHVVGGVAHDFNNLLTAILSAVEMLGPMAAREPAAQSVLGELGHLAKRGSRLTHQLLSFVRKQDIQPQVMDLNAAVTDIQKMLHRLIGEDIELSLSLAADLWFVRADPGHVEQILMNLAVNARDAMPEGGRLTIRTENEPAGRGPHAGPHVVLSVTDTGCGMEPAVLARIFEPFFTTKPVGKGTGLGLPTVRTIVDQHSGHIEVLSAPGRGSTFLIRLPRVELPAPSPLPGSATEMLSAGSETVLLVEDEDFVRRGMRESLQRLGYVVLDARNGPEALDLYRKRAAPIQMIVTDVIMPRMTGPELAHQLALLGCRARVLFVSGYTDDAVANAGLLNPGVSFLQKPFSPDALAARVRQILSDAPQDSARVRLVHGM
jgi:two-component system cell cycle sensor histidine kinase/response regulator CckA